MYKIVLFSSLQHLTTTRHLHTMPTSYSPRNSVRSKRHANAISQVLTNPSISHKSVTSTRHFNIKNAKKTKKAYNFFQNCETSEEIVHLYDTRRSDVTMWSICMEVTDLCGSDGFVWKWRISLELMHLYGSGRVEVRGNHVILAIFQKINSIEPFKLIFLLFDQITTLQ